MRLFRFILCSIILIAALLACTLGQRLPETGQPAGNSTTTGMPPQSNPPTDTLTPTAHIQTVDDFFTRCPTADEVARVNSDFKVSFEYDPTAPTLVCRAADGSADLTALQKRAYQTIYVTKLLNFNQPLPWTDKQLYDWLVGAIDGIRFIDGKGSGYSFCCEPENTIVIALNSNTYILLTDHWFEANMGGGLMNTMFLYIHEARHNEGYGHTCTSRSGDDNRVDEMGAWSVQYYLALWIGQYGDRQFLKVPGGDPNAYRQAALNDSQQTREVRFCLDPAPPIPTLIP